MRILVDYRPALRERTGVGEYVHNLVGAFVRDSANGGDEVFVFTSSWKDRPGEHLHLELGARIVDRRVPVRVLNYLWHRLEWPPVEILGPNVDVVHAAHPLLIPSSDAAQVITIHDLYFLTNRESMRAEIRRDYAALVPCHARRADAIVVNSRYTASLVASTLQVAAASIHVCSPGAPVWKSLGQRPNLPADGYVLFIGTLEKRKNVGALLAAYERLLDRGQRVPPLVLAGRATPDASEWLARLSHRPLAGHVRYLGYVDEKEHVYAGARLLVLPSLDEGFGIPALEAMAAGVPVIAAARGALPELIGTAGILVDPTDVEALATAICRMLSDTAFAAECAQRGLARARQFSWTSAAASLRGAYEAAIEAHRCGNHCDLRAKSARGIF
jgi:glycosyltransferase involved in cell wall biosynthesis